MSPQRIAVVTGATEGIGKETATELAAKGLLVVVHGRSAARARQAADEVAKASGASKVDVCVADFASVKQVRAMAEGLAATYPRIDVLLNNAGVFVNERTVTEDGFELTVAVNHFAHFVLTHALISPLGASDQGRVVHVASGVHSSGRVDLDDLSFERSFSGYEAYASSKLMNVLFSNELARRLRGTRVTSNALHPGVIATKLLRKGFGAAGGASLAAGARTSVKVATDSIAREDDGRVLFGRARGGLRTARARPKARAGLLRQELRAHGDEANRRGGARVSDQSDCTVVHVKRRSDPPVSSADTAQETRAEPPIEAVDDIAQVIAEMRKPPAERLDDQGLVASGGMGSVHLVVDRAIGRRMAMKTMHTMLREDDRMLRLFLREARTTGLLDHPNIVPVYDVGNATAPWISR